MDGSVRSDLALAAIIERMTVPVVCAYTQLRPETKAALPPDAMIVDVSDGPGEDNSRYYWLLQALWFRKEGMLTVEHDVVPYEGAIEGLLTCEQPWCAVPYQVGINIGTWLGLTKFAPEIMVAVPDAFDRMERTAFDSIDGQLLPYLRQKGYRTHVHWPAASHLNRCGDPSIIIGSCPCGGAIRFEQARLGPNAVRCPKCGGYVNLYPWG